MKRINAVFLWGFFLIAMFAAGAGSVPADHDRIDFQAVAACTIIGGFLLWPVIGFAYALKIALDGLFASWRVSKARSIAVRIEPTLQAPALDPEIVPEENSACFCRAIPAGVLPDDSRCLLGKCLDCY